MAPDVRVLTGPAALDFLTTRWPELYRQDHDATPYQSASWLTGWATQLPDTGVPMVLLALTGSGRTLAALALSLTHDELPDRGGISALSAPRAEYVRPVGRHAEDPDVAAAFARHLVALSYAGNRIAISDVPTAGSLGRHLAQAGADAGWHHGTTDCAAVPLPLDLAGLSRATRKDHQRRRRTWELLATERDVAYRRTRDRDDLLTACDTLARLSAARQTDRPASPGTPFAGDAEQWRAVLSACGTSQAFIATLAVDGVVAAAQLCLYRHRTAYSVATGMNPRHMPLAPGHALLRHLAADLAADGFTTLDLGRTTPNQRTYKAQYHPHWSTTLTVIGGRRSTTPTSAATAGDSTLALIHSGGSRVVC